MRKSISKIALAATLGLALALTFSCSSGGGGNTHHTYYYSVYGVNKNSLNSCSTVETLFTSNSPNPDKSFKDVKERWDEVKRLDVSFVESGTGLTESDIKNILVKSDVPPKEADNHIALLKSRGNGCAAFNSSDYRYCYVLVYIEQE